LLEEKYLEARRLAEHIATRSDPPLFYIHKENEVEASRKIFDSHPMVQRSLRIVEKGEDNFGHGLSHVSKVAVDAGALVMIEKGGSVSGQKLERMVLLAHVAGVLHDIKREEPEHAERGAEEADKILKDFHLTETECNAIVQAIRNHEAFKPPQPLDEPSLQIVSDALYDADKFRWGPDNFTETVWMMVSRMKVPYATLLKRFLPGLKGIERISETFRTSTGKKYGPDFIARGLDIGRRLFGELQERYVAEG
jgi:HD domain-containing protein